MNHKIEEYIKDERSPRTLAGFKSSIERYVFAKDLPYTSIADKFVSDLSVQDIIDFKNNINSFMGDTYAKTTIANVFGAINNVLEFAKYNSQITNDVLNEIYVPPRGKAQPSKKAVRNFFSYKEFCEYMEVFEKNSYDYFLTSLAYKCNNKFAIKIPTFIASFRKSLYTAFFNFIFFTGARRNEARGVKWNDLIYPTEDFELYQVRIDKQYSEDSAYFIYEDVYTRKPKSSSSIRECVLHEQCASSLIEFREFLIKYNLYDENDYIFKDFFTQNQKPIPTTNLNRVFRHFLDMSGIEQRSRPLNDIERHITIHGMRHSACSYYLELGMEKHDVATFLGHSNTEMVEYVYSHFIHPADMEKEKKLKNMKFFRQR